MHYKTTKNTNFVITLYQAQLLYILKDSRIKLFVIIIYCNISLNFHPKARGRKDWGGWRDKVHLLATGFVLYCSDKRFLHSIWAVFALMGLLQEAVDTGCFKLLQWKTHHNMKKRGGGVGELVDMLCCGVLWCTTPTAVYLQLISSYFTRNKPSVCKL